MNPALRTATCGALLATALMNERQRAEFATEMECNFAIAIPELSRFRVNVLVVGARSSTCTSRRSRWSRTARSASTRTRGSTR